MVMKGCVQWNPIYGGKDFDSSGAGTQDHYINRPALNPLSYRGFINRNINVSAHDGLHYVKNMH